MAGAGFENDLLFASNADFSGGSSPAIANGLATNGQLWIGTTAVNAGSTHVNVGAITSPLGTITIGFISPNITLDITGGSAAVEHLTGDTGGQLNPDAANNFNLLGQQAGTIPVMDTIGSGSTIRFEDRSWFSAFVVDASATVGLRGTYQTIAAASAAASAGDTVFIRPGTYTENLTLKAGVQYTGMIARGGSGERTKVIGKWIDNGSTIGCTLQNLTLQTNSDFTLVMTGAATNIVLRNCFLNNTNSTGISLGTGCTATIIACDGDLGTTGISYWSGVGSVECFNCRFINSGGSSTVSTTSGQNISLTNSSMSAPLSTTSTGAITLYDSIVDTSATNTASITTAGSGTSFIYPGSALKAGSASAISAGVGTTVECYNSTINSTNANAISGAGSIKYANLAFINTSSTINTTTQVPRVTSNDALKVVTPGAYPYTTTCQDAVILVDTSSARTITPLASPATGQKHIIKDSVGSAAANNITITPSGKNIDGAASYTINLAYGSVTIVFNGTEWNNI